MDEIYVFLLLTALLVPACFAADQPSRQASAPADLAAVLVRVTNLSRTLDRSRETVTLSMGDLDRRLPGLGKSHPVVFDLLSRKEIPSQVLDRDLNGGNDQLIFQTDLDPGGRRDFSIRVSAHTPAKRYAPLVYGRYVKERADDFAWENDRIAFRMYGPALRSETISSGVDVWCKRIPYLIINKWYAGAKDNYHVDHGEGADFFKVGDTRGCGGTAIWFRNRMFVSDNYSTFTVLANGPIRTVFELTYTPWAVDGMKVSEVKRVSLDAGSNLSRFDVFYHCDPPARKLDYVAGLRKLPNETAFSSDKDLNWMGSWSPIDPAGNGNLGIGVVMDPAAFVGFVDVSDHHLAEATAIPGKAATHYAGAGWSGSKQFSSAAEWFGYLKEFAARLRSPVRVEYITQ